MNLPPELTRKILEMDAATKGRPADDPRRTLKSPTGKIKTGHKQPDAHRLFDALCAHYGLPCPEHEYQFALHLGRKWAFDHLFEGWLAVEKEGGIWKAGRHVRGQGFLDDMEKYNHAVLLGYSVIRFTPQQFEDGSAFVFIKRVLESEDAQP